MTNKLLNGEKSIRFGMGLLGVKTEYFLGYQDGYKKSKEEIKELQHLALSYLMILVAFSLYLLWRWL